MQQVSITALATLVLTTFSLAGCQQESESNSDGGNKSGAASSIGTPKPVEHTVTAQPYVQTVTLPGASVQGKETTLLMAKLGGYVAEISKLVDAEALQSLPPEVQQVFAKPADARDPLEQKLADRYAKDVTAEVDIGSRVKQGDVLAVLSIPEMEFEMEEKRAEHRETEAEVEQAEAAIEQANANATIAEKRIAEARAFQTERQAMQNLREVELKRIAGLVGRKAIGAENQDEAEYKLKAAQASVASAESGIATAIANLAAAKANQRKAASDKRRAEARAEVASRAVQRLETLWEYRHIKAPFDGVIVERNVDHGTFVKPATSNSGAMPLFKIIRTNQVRIVASVPSTSAERIHVGNEARFDNIGGLPGVAVKGHVSRSSTSFDVDSRMMRIEIHLQNPTANINSDSQPVALKPGMFGTVTVTVQKWDALPIVPASAVIIDGGQTFVVVVKNGQFETRRVTIAFNDAINVGISSGLDLNERVVAKDTEKYRQ